MGGGEKAGRPEDKTGGSSEFIGQPAYSLAEWGSSRFNDNLSQKGKKTKEIKFFPWLSFTKILFLATLRLRLDNHDFKGRLGYMVRRK